MSAERARITSAQYLVARQHRGQSEEAEDLDAEQRMDDDFGNAVLTAMVRPSPLAISDDL